MQDSFHNLTVIKYETWIVGTALANTRMLAIILLIVKKNDLFNLYPSLVLTTHNFSLVVLKILFLHHP